MQILKNLWLLVNVMNIVAFHKVYLPNNNNNNNNNNFYKKTQNLYYNKKHIILSESNNTIQNATIIVQHTNIVSKWNGFVKIIRPNNILPTFLLCLTGGWIINPSIYNLLHSQSFLISTINTILIMSNSMIINDLYDINIDKINSPNRPLVTGEITKTDAIIYIISLLSITEYLNYRFLPSSLQWIIHLAILNTIIYTPILKKMLLIKNISCAALVAWSKAM